MSVMEATIGDATHHDRGYKIKYPSTTNDLGAPSDDMYDDCHRILDMIDDERHLLAEKLYISVKTRLIDHPGRPGHPTKQGGFLKRKKIKKAAETQEGEYNKIVAFLERHKETLETLEKKAAVFARARRELQKNDDWVLSQTFFGITTFYRKESDGSLSIKMEGQLHDVPIFEQVAIVREVDLHQTWVPFCTSSITVKEIDKLDTVGWFVIGAPQFGLARDGMFRAIGCDNMVEEGSILIVGQGIEDRPEGQPYAEPYFMEGLEGIDFPDKPTRMGSGRITIRHFAATIDILSATSLETTLVANINPNLPLPQSLLDFVTRKICGVALSKLQHAAKKVGKDPIRNEHAQRMRQDHEFYKGWLLPKFESFCNMSHWAMPKVTALFLTEQEQEKEFEYIESRNRFKKSSTKSRGSASDDQSQDTISRLTISSNVSKSTHNNPIGKYLHEMEQKTEEKKARKIVAARQRAANRLKPKHLSDVQLSRLKELKDAKERRIRNKGVPETIIEVERVDTPKKKHRKRKSVISHLHSHSRSTRFFTATMLSCIMAIVLNPEVLTRKFLDLLEHYEENWWSAILLDIGTLVYIAFCAIVHFACCDVAMVYAYGALDLGMKTGKQVKQYYSDSVRILVAALSGSIITFCTGKAILRVALRAIVWNSMRGFSTISEMVGDAEVFLDSYLPHAVVSFPGSALSFGLGIVTFLASKAYMVVSFFLWLFGAVIHSNRVGQFVAMVASSLITFVPSLQANWDAYVEHVISVYEDAEMVPTWRSEAIESTRFLLAYTAVFLLSILVLFNASSRENKRKNEKWQSLNSEMSEEHLEKYEKFESLRLSSRESGFGKSSGSLDDELSVSVGNISLSAGTPASGRKQRRFKLRLHKKDSNEEIKLSERAPTQSVVVY